MAQATSKLPVKTEGKARGRASALEAWRPFESLPRDVDRLFEDFDRDFWTVPFSRPIFGIEPFWRRDEAWGGAPFVDVVENDDAYEVTVELPGMDEKNVEVKLVDGGLTIKGEKQEETEEKEKKEKNYYLHERHYGAFERSFTVPEGVDADKIEATFKKGVLTVTLPKTLGAQKTGRKIEVKAA